MSYLSDNSTIPLFSGDNDENVNVDNLGSNKKPPTAFLSLEKCAGHADHWCLLTDKVSEDIPKWLQNMVDKAKVPHGLASKASVEDIDHAAAAMMTLCTDEDIHINQILSLNNGKPSHLINAFPCVNSPYGFTAKIERSIVCEETQDAILKLVSADGTTVYAFDQLYTVNHELYNVDTEYFINLSAWIYRIKLSNECDDVIVIEDQESIRYHRAYGDIVAANDGIVPDDLAEQIAQWQPDEVDADGNLAPIEISMQHMCAYLFGETFGQEDDAWCQGQVIGKQKQSFEGIDVILFDVVILREPNVKPLVVRMAATSNQDTDAIQVNDYIQANMWMQAAIYNENQNP